MSESSLAKELFTQTLRAACDEVEECLRGGDLRAVETILEKYPEFSRDVDFNLEVIYAEFTLRAEMGQSPSESEYYERFPKWKDAIRRLMEVHRTFDQPSVSGTSTLVTNSLTHTEAATSLANEPSSNQKQIGDYEILDEIGRGGTGRVYRARDLRLGRIVALKTLLSVDVDDEQLDRFRYEAESAAKLQHPNIVQVFEVCQQGEVSYLAMEYVEAGTLEALIAEEPIRPLEAAEMVRRLALAMHYAHGQGVVHRDLKPANILMGIDEDGELRQPKVADFGLAKQSWASEANRTRTGAILGTPGYMAPEQANGDAELIGPTTDVYALGAILYQLLTHRPPFHAGTLLETLDQVRSAEPVAPLRLNPQMSRDLDTICLKCLQKDPASRYQTAEDLAADLQRFLDGKPIVARPVGTVERCRKWARRRPAIAVTIAMSIAMSLVFGILAVAGVILEGKRAEERARDAIADRNKVDRARQREQEKVQSLIDLVTRLSGMGQQLSNSSAHDAVRIRAHRESVQMFDKLVEERPGDTQLLLHRGSAYAALGSALWEISQPEEAEKYLSVAVYSLEALISERDFDRDRLHKLAQAHLNYAHVLREAGKWDESESSYRRALEIWEKFALDAEVALEDPRVWMAAAMNNLCVVLRHGRRNDEAEAMYRTAIQLLGDANKDHRYGMVLRYLPSVANRRILQRIGAAAKKDSADSSDADETADSPPPAPRDYPAQPVILTNLAISLDDLGQLLAAKGQFEEAESYSRRALAAREWLLSLSPTDPSVLSFAARSNNRMGLLYIRLKKYKEAIPFFERAIPMEKRAMEVNPLRPFHRHNLVLMELKCAYAMRKCDQFDAAYTLLLDAHNHWSGLPETYVNRTSANKALAREAEKLGNTQYHAEAYEGCRRAWKLSMSVSRAIPQENAREFQLHLAKLERWVAESLMLTQQYDAADYHLGLAEKSLVKLMKESNSWSLREHMARCYQLRAQIKLGRFRNPSE